MGKIPWGRIYKTQHKFFYLFYIDFHDAEIWKSSDLPSLNIFSSVLLVLCSYAGFESLTSKAKILNKMYKKYVIMFIITAGSGFCNF